MGVFTVLIYYNLASKLKFHYTNIKNNFSNDNKYLAMVKDSGLWIKDEIGEKTLIIKSEYVKGNFLSQSIINEFNSEFQLIRTIQSEKIDITEKNWVIFNPIITEKNVSQENIENLIFKQLMKIELINYFQHFYT